MRASAAQILFFVTALCAANDLCRYWERGDPADAVFGVLWLFVTAFAAYRCWCIHIRGDVPPTH